jgi:conjugative relaxase-like TrwC/TraI family protein
VLSVAKLARGREEYYLATLAGGREESGGLIEPDGRWLGSGAVTLGLSGTVDGPGLRTLLTGVDPVTGEVLAERHARVRVVAYDCTYSTPKSVSLLHALGPQDVRAQVCAGHEEAAEAALGYLERRAARVRRRPGRGEPAASVPAGGFVAACFLHRTSRAPDPHLHSHVLVANLAQGPEGRWSALDGRGLYLELGTARDLYETQLRSELTHRLGVSWRELRGSWADLAGIDPKVVRAFSRRSAEIEAALEQSGLSSPSARRLAALKTRPEKDLGTAYEELVSDWRERSYRLGVSDSRLAAVAGRSQAELPIGPGSSVTGAGSEAGALEPGGASPFERWAERVLGDNGVTARDGTCRRGELVRARCGALGSGAPVHDVERDVESLVTEGRLVPVPDASRPFGPSLKSSLSRRSIPGGLVEPLHTTPEVLDLYDRMRQLLQAHRGAVELLGYRPGERLEALDTLGGFLSEPETQIVALAPGRAAAASFEAVTGIETTPVAALGGAAARPVGGPGPGGIVVVAEAHRFGPWELSSLLQSSLASRSRVILFAPTASLEAGLGPVAVLAPDIRAFASPSLEHGLTPGRSELDTHERHRFAGREVLVVGGGPAAREALVETWARARQAGQSWRIVASDDWVVRSLRESVCIGGGAADDVIEARRLAASNSARPEESFVVLGALPTSLGEAQACRCLQVVVVPTHRGFDERLAVAAELARPRYLVSELGAVKSSFSERAAWRKGAQMIENFRRRFSIDDHEHAFGDRRALRNLDIAVFSEAAETRLKLRQAARVIEPSSPGAGRHSPASLGRSR